MSAQAAEMADSKGWAVELQRQAKAHRTQQLDNRTKAAAAVDDLKAGVFESMWKICM
jgi:hypothetical protein